MMDTVGVEHLGSEHHFGGLIWELLGEGEACFVETAFEGGVFGALEAEAPFEHVFVFEAHRHG